MTNKPPEIRSTPDQDREYAYQLWKAQQARNELSAMVNAPRNTRRRARTRLVLGIVWVVVAIACFFVWRYLYLNYLWH